VLGYDCDPAALAAALACGALGASVASLRALGERVDILVLASPVDATLTALEELAREPVAAGLIFDVGSVKAAIARAGRAIPAFVPTHPIAGSEQSGAAAARSDLFAGRTWAYDPAIRADARVGIERFIAAMGADPFAIESAEHDRIVALTSHLPQVLAVALGARLRPHLDDATATLCGSGMRSMLRLGASSYPMWRPILAANRFPLAQEVRALAAILSEAARALESDAVDDLAGTFALAAACVAELRASDTAPAVAAHPAD
jgi:prephenate dehydrogenase